MEEHRCMCCYCETKGKAHNEEYIRGLTFAVDYVRAEYELLAQGLERNRANCRSGKTTERMMRRYNAHIETKMRFLGEWHDILAKEGNKAIKLIKDIDWKEELYGDHDE